MTGAEYWRDRSPESHTVLLCGTFDVLNFGDLLFPHIARFRLERLGIRIKPVSPTAIQPAWADTVPVTAISDALAGSSRIDGVLIGGGNIIHAKPTDLAHYVEHGVAQNAYRSLWLDVSDFAGRHGLPVAWNAPGVPGPFDASQRQAVERALSQAQYVSVRDRASAAHLGCPGAQIVPDTAFDIAALWPRASLKDSFRLLLQRADLGEDRKCVAIHVKRRSLDGPIDVLARNLDDFCRSRRLTPILVALGPCHGDDAVVGELARHLTCGSILLNRPAGLRQIAAAIAYSECYLGASMHGYVAAAAYGRPGVIVARPRLVKMAGLLEHLARPQDEVPDWPAGFAAAASRLGQTCPAVPDKVSRDLDTHWRMTAQTVAVAKKYA